LLVLSLTLFACEGVMSSNSPQSNNQAPSPSNNNGGDGADMGSMNNRVDGGDMDSPSNAGNQLPANDCGVTALYQGLEPTCGSCHRVGNSPYFTSPESFYSLLVKDPAWVTPGDPGASALIALLEGRATGAYAQMPLGNETFAELEAAGKTSVTIAEISTFIQELEGCERPPAEEADIPDVERKSARQILNTLYQHLGITSEDVVRFTSSRNWSLNRYPMHNPDDVKPVTMDPHISPPNQAPGLRWFAMGGGSQLYGTRPNKRFSPTFGQNLVQLSQAWCGFAVDKEDNTALFKHVSQDALAEATDAQIEDNLRYLMLRFWGHVATDEEVQSLKTNVYEPYASEQNPRTAWVAVCAALVRDPMWINY
jgi:hypothetical protein